MLVPSPSVCGFSVGLMFHSPWHLRIELRLSRHYFCKTHYVCMRWVVCMRECVDPCTGVCEHTEARTELVSSSPAVSLIPLRQHLSLNQSSPFLLVWLTMELLGSCCLYPLVLEYRYVQPCLDSYMSDDDEMSAKQVLLTH